MSTSVAEPVDGEVLSLEQLLAKIELPSGKSVSARKFVPRKVSFTDLSDTGAAGELVALNRERERLNSAGRADLSAKVLHVSRELGDGAGYDILSFALDESELYVEVKTTTGPPDTPFYITANELAFAKKASKSYKLVRLYSFEKATGTCGEFVISADELASLTTVPVTFQCLVRK